MTIFISYNWTDSKTIDEIEERFKTIGISVVRDKKNIIYKDDLYEFMERIRTEDYALVYISDNYLKSVNCMREATELLKELEFDKKILPIVADNCSITDKKYHLSLIKHWEDKSTELSNEIKDISPENGISLWNELRLHKEIQSNIDLFIDKVCRCQYQTYQDLNKSNYINLFEYLGFPNLEPIVKIFNILSIKDISLLKNKALYYIFEYPKMPYGYIVLGDKSLTKNEYNEAIYYYNKAIQNGGDKMGNVYSQLALAKCYLSKIATKKGDREDSYNKNMVEDIEKDFLISVKLDNRNDKAYGNFAMFYKRIGEIEKAKKTFIKELELNPNKEDAYFNFGTLFSNIEEYQDAYINYTKAIELNPKESFYYNRADILYKMGKYPESINDYSKCIELNPTDPRTYFFRASVYYELKKWDLAIADYSMTIKYHPANLDSYKNRGMLFTLIGKYPEAIADFNSIININPKYFLAYLYRSNVYMMQGREEDAMSDLKEVVNLTDKAEEKFCGVGYQQIKDGNFKLALDNINKAIHIKPDYKESYFYRAGIYGTYKQYDYAIKDYNLYLKFDPDCVEALRNKEMCITKLIKCN